MRALLTTLGSHGDVHPFIALALELKRRGHQALLMTNPMFQAQIARAGVDFAPLTEHADMKDIMANYAVMHPSRGARVVLRDLTVPMVPTMFERTADAIRAFRPDVLLNHPICFGCPWAAEKAGVRVVSVTLAPIAWMGSEDPIVFGSWRSYNPPLWATKLDAFVGRYLMRWMLDGPLNALRRQYALPKIKDHLISEFSRPGLNLGLWSPAFRGPAKGDPQGATICGWAWFDSHHDHQAPADEIAEFVDDGEPPIVFTLGSAAVHAPGRFYRAAAEAARLLSRRAVLLIGRQEYVQQLQDLPKGVRAFSYAPFSWLLPHAVLTVHHAGIGSTGQALRAARPSLGVPMAHDQFDNAARVKRLGVGDVLPHAKVTPERLARVLRPLLEDPGYAQRASALARRIGTESGAVHAVTALESFLTR